MRLINVATLELEDFFFDGSIPQYAILSHTWLSGEVNFQEWLRHFDDEQVREKRGYAKILGACEQAEKDGLKYLWCDTNCINKESSSELSEAINSMYAWYYKSVVCYVYLADVEVPSTLTSDETISLDSLKHSRWFTRGWTLQELLAPMNVRFFDKQWTPLGDKKSLAATISEITNIHPGALENRSSVKYYSIAQRMSWAATRTTSRIEDIAYCLLGIFRVHMTMRYGEGDHAFTRLQNAIMQASDDQSIFAWDSLHPSTEPWSGVLAGSPANFQLCGSIIEDYNIIRQPYSSTNVGISVKIPLLKTQICGIYFAGLNCGQMIGKGRSEGEDSGIQGNLPTEILQIWIPLRKIGFDCYERAHLPVSKINFLTFYEITTPRELSDVYLVPSKLPNDMSLARTQESVVRSQIVISSEFRICLAFGFWSPTGVLKSAQPSGDFAIMNLRSRCTCPVSLALISNESFTVFLAAAWSMVGGLLRCQHKVLLIPKRNLERQLATMHQSIDTAMRGCIYGNNSDRLDSLIQDITSYFGEAQETNTSPLVIIPRRTCEDTYGRPEIKITIIFRENQSPVKEYSARFSAVA